MRFRGPVGRDAGRRAPPGELPSAPVGVPVPASRECVRRYVVSRPGGPRCRSEVGVPLSAFPCWCLLGVYGDMWFRGLAGAERQRARAACLWARPRGPGHGGHVSAGGAPEGALSGGSLWAVFPLATGRPLSEATISKVTSTRCPRSCGSGVQGRWTRCDRSLTLRKIERNSARAWAQNGTGRRPLRDVNGRCRKAARRTG